MAWSTPKTDWVSSDAIGNGDLNRMEANTAFIADNPSGDLLELAPDGGVVLIGASAVDGSGAEFQVNGDASAVGHISVYSGKTLARLDALSVGGALSINNATGTLKTLLRGYDSGGVSGYFNSGGAYLFNTTTDNGSGAKLQVNGDASADSVIFKDTDSREVKMVSISITTADTQNEAYLKIEADLNLSGYPSGAKVNAIGYSEQIGAKTGIDYITYTPTHITIHAFLGATVFNKGTGTSVAEAAYFVSVVN